MRRGSLLILVFLMFVSCQPEPIRMVNEFYENGQEKNVNYYKSIHRKVLVKQELFYESGKMKVSGSFKDGQKHGQWIFYYENGLKANEDWFFEGEPDGRSTSWNKNGTTRSNGYYKHGERVREWTWFDETGRLIKRVNY